MRRQIYLQLHFQMMPEEKRIVRNIYRQLHHLAFPEITRADLRKQYQRHKLVRLIYEDLNRIAFKDEHNERQRVNRRKRIYGKLNNISAMVYELHKEIKCQEKNRKS